MHVEKTPDIKTPSSEFIALGFRVQALGGKELHLLDVFRN